MEKKKILRNIRVIARELRTRAGHSQQSWAHEMGWSITSAVRFENGGRPGVKALWEMVTKAQELGFDDLATELLVFFNVSAGRDLPVVEQGEEMFIARARRVWQNPRRHKAFLEFTAPEGKLIEAENAEKAKRADELASYLDAITKGGKRK